MTSLFWAVIVNNFITSSFVNITDVKTNTEIYLKSSITEPKQHPIERPVSSNTFLHIAVVPIYWLIFLLSGNESKTKYFWSLQKFCPFAERQW